MKPSFAVLYHFNGTPEIYTFTSAAVRDAMCMSNPALIPITAEAADRLAYKYGIPL